MKPASFANRAAFRAWLSKHHASETELLLRCVKVAHRDEGVTYHDALDEALCFGWIDGVRRSLDAKSFSQRFTPRKPKSAWSRVNIRKFAALEKAGAIAPPGQAAFDRRARPSYSYESKPKRLSPAFVKRLRAESAVWRFWDGLPPGYRRLMAFYVMSAKQPGTRERRFDVLLRHARQGKRIPLLAKDRT